MTRYIPKQGDFIFLDFDPQSGREQRGRRPALVVSRDPFNKKTGFAMCCPITNTDRAWQLHVEIPDEAKLTGFIMCEQLKSLDYRIHKIDFVEKATQETLSEVLARIDACIYSDDD